MMAETETLAAPKTAFRMTAEQQFLRQLKQSHRLAVMLLIGPLAVLLIIGYFANDRIRASAEPLREITAATQALPGRGPVEKVNSALAVLDDAEKRYADLSVQLIALQQTIVYLEAQLVDQADTGSERCGLPRPNNAAFVFFGLSNADTTPSIEVYLDSYLERLAAEGAIGGFVVHGYADAAGTTEVNKQVSMARAEGVATYLRNKNTFPALRFLSDGHGNVCPAADRKGDQRNPCHRLAIVVPESATGDFGRYCAVAPAQ